jgi:hypothetical protein
VTKAMPEPQLAHLFSEALDRLDYAMMDARLWLFDLMHGAQLPTPADRGPRTARRVIRPGNND